MSSYHHWTNDKENTPLRRSRRPGFPPAFNPELRRATPLRKHWPYNDAGQRRYKSTYPGQVNLSQVKSLPLGRIQQRQYRASPPPRPVKQVEPESQVTRDLYKLKNPWKLSTYAKAPKPQSTKYDSYYMPQPSTPSKGFDDRRKRYLAGSDNLLLTPSSNQSMSPNPSAHRSVASSTEAVDSFHLPDLGRTAEAFLGQERRGRPSVKIPSGPPPGLRNHNQRNDSTNARMVEALQHKNESLARDMARLQERLDEEKTNLAEERKRTMEQLRQISRKASDVEQLRVEVETLKMEKRRQVEDLTDTNSALKREVEKMKDLLKESKRQDSERKAQVDRVQNKLLQSQLALLKDKQLEQEKQLDCAASLAAAAASENSSKPIIKDVADWGSLEERLWGSQMPMSANTRTTEDSLVTDDGLQALVADIVDEEMEMPLITVATKGGHKGWSNLLGSKVDQSPQVETPDSASAWSVFGLDLYTWGLPDEIVANSAARAAVDAIPKAPLLPGISLM